MGTGLMAMPNGVEYQPRPMLMDEIMQMAHVLYKAGMTSGGASKPEHIAAKILHGIEVGLKPMQACNQIMIVNGKTTIWGDAALAIVRKSGRLASIKEYVEGEDLEAVAVCEVHRRGDAEPRQFRFSMMDAKRAKLADKKGPWQEYPKRMLALRPRSWALRDVFGDVLCGLGIYEEAIDRADVTVTADAATTDATSSPVPDAIMRVDDATLEKIAEARDAWLRWAKVDVNNAEVVRIEWAAKLHEYGTDSARKLYQDDANRLLADLLGSVEHGRRAAEPSVFPDVEQLDANRISEAA